MSWAGRALLLSAGLCTIVLSGALAHADQSPVTGGRVPSTLSLSLGEPSPFTRSGHGFYTATLPAEVTATVAPVRLSFTEGTTSTPLRSWPAPVSRAPAWVRLRREARSLRKGGRLLITLTAGGP